MPETPARTPPRAHGIRLSPEPKRARCSRHIPGPLPHGDRSLELSLVPFGPEALETFLRIERPETTNKGSTS
ncbi:ferritin-like domain-containing protein [Nonomuraea polychroma]|uniref:ferritin-like domain-containing protein n=1 Tax=Nonomuraea polychroma TaxID=46176 RepID=UPI0019D4E4CC